MDIVRSKKTNEKFDQEDKDLMRRILIALLRRNSDIGYC